MIDNIVTSNEEADVQWVTVPVSGSDLREVAKKLLAAAGAEQADKVRSLTGGFRVPYAIAKEAGVLDRIAGEEAEVSTKPTTGAPSGDGEPSGQTSDEDDDAEASTPADKSTDAAPAKAARSTKSAQS